MSNEPLPGRNTFSRQLCPGVWEDADGNPHISIAELLLHVGLEDTPENQERAWTIVRETLAKELPGVEVIERPVKEG